VKCDAVKLERWCRRRRFQKRWNAGNPLQNYQIWRGNTIVRSLLSGVSNAPTPKERGPSDPHLWGSLLFIITPFVAELPNLTWQHVGEGAYHGVVHTSHPKRAEFQSSPIFEVLLYLCLQPLTQNDQIGQWWHMWGRACFITSDTPLHLHKCVARFVSDSCFFCIFCWYSQRYNVYIPVYIH